MKPAKSFRPAITLALIASLLGVLCVNSANRVATAQAQVSVTAADPPSGPQGTINLNVKVTGKGFKNGAKAKWLVTGTTDPGGVTVNSTTFVSSTELNSNITIADTAVISNFDIAVTNPDGRGGKGTELFAVTAKGGGQSACPAMQPAPTSDTKCYAMSPGCLDSTFGSVGYVHIDPDPYVGSANGGYGVTVQSDGKIVIIGQVRRSYTDIDYVLVRYNVDGTLDTSFGDPDPINPPFRLGYTITQLTTGFDYVYSTVVQPDGKIVVSGWTNESVVVRYNADGTLDNSFGNGGIAHLGAGAPARDVTVQSDGKVVVAGSAGSTNLFSIVRLNPSGSLDSTFGSNGQVTVNPSGSKRGFGNGWGVAIQRVPAITGEERIVVVGRSLLSSSSNADWTMMRFRSNGATDTSFGSSGIVKTYFSGFGDQARKVQIDSSNRIVVSGFTNSYSDSCGSYVTDAALVRYNQDGTLDGSFGGGKQVVDIYGGNDGFAQFILQTDGKIVIPETAHSADGTVHHFALVRFNLDGSRDSSFGLLGNGVVTTDLYGAANWAYAVAVDPTNGKIVVTGAVYFPSGGPADIAVARYLP
jgi:uncharacterized delta-60 repeat protein